MFNHIEKIRQKPENIKRRFTLLITLFFFLIVLLLWFFMSSLEVVPKKNIDTAPAQTPFVGIKNTVENIVSDIKTKTKGLGDNFNIK